MNKDWIKVIRFDRSIASILLFEVNIPLISKSIRFGSKSTKMEADNKIKLE